MADKPSPVNISVTLGEIIGVVLVGYIILRALNQSSVVDPNGSVVAPSWWDAFLVSAWTSFTGFALYFTIASNIISALFFMGIVYAVIRLTEINKEEHTKLYPPAQETKDEQASAPVQPHESKWDKILLHLSSDNENDWRLAILEADVLLDELLDRLGYIGNSIGDKLKRVEKSDFTTIDLAWEAHKVRNLIAHEGSDYVFNEREARRVIGLYAQVFKEFKFV